jgi:predicted metal-dependent phosphoesterase TrpH
LAVDLHLHSTQSDGTDPPAEIVRLAAEAGLTALALTDHDTLDGVPEARRAADALGIDLISGTELSVNWPTGTMHLLVYHLEPGPGPLQDELAALREARTTRNEQIVARLNELGIEMSVEDVLVESGGGVVGRPHIAAVLVARGHADSIPDAFDRYLASGRPGYVDRRRLDAIETIDLATQTGAVAVLAHPHTLGIAAADFETAFAQLAAAGLGGIESYYAQYEPELRAHLAAICGRLGVIPTGGSDYHGRYKPGLAVGRGQGDLSVPDDIVDRIAAAAG